MTLAWALQPLRALERSARCGACAPRLRVPVSDDLAPAPARVDGLEALVVTVETGDAALVVLDRTVFYPGGGGQRQSVELPVDEGGDDAFEMFGGTPFLDHIVAVGNIDDNFDTDSDDSVEHHIHEF